MQQRPCLVLSSLVGLGANHLLAEQEICFISCRFVSLQKYTYVLTGKTAVVWGGDFLIQHGGTGWFMKLKGILAFIIFNFSP